MILCIYSLLILYKCLFGVFFFFCLYSSPLVWNLGSIPITHLVYIKFSWKLSTQNLIDTNVHKKEHLRFRGLAFSLCPRTKTRRFFTQNLENTICWRENLKNPKFQYTQNYFFIQIQSFLSQNKVWSWVKSSRLPLKWREVLLGLLVLRKMYCRAHIEFNRGEE